MEANQKSLKSRLTMKILSILENYTNSIDNKQDNILSYKIMILLQHILEKMNIKADILSRKN